MIIYLEDGTTTEVKTGTREVVNYVSTKDPNYFGNCTHYIGVLWIYGDIRNNKYLRICFNFICLHEGFEMIIEDRTVKTMDDFYTYWKKTKKKYLPRLLKGCPCMNYIQWNYFQDTQDQIIL